MFREFFYMQKSDRRVVMGLLTVGAAALIILFLAGGKDPQPSQPLSQQVDSTSIQTPTTQQEEAYAQPVVAPERFAFDPNTADSTQLLRLGLQPWQVRNIYRYRAAGGVYRKKEDFARLYGLTVKQYRELEPYIHISADYLPASTLFEHRTPSTHHDTPSTHRDSIAGDKEEHTLRYPVKLAEGETIDLSTADTTTLKRIPGIGPYYARKIADYGKRLGGYTSIEQLDEIDDFPQEAKAYITLEHTSVVKLNINSLSLNELKKHPYINFYQARAIVDYRRQHGTISDLSDLRLLPEFPEEAIRRLRPYVEY